MTWQEPWRWAELLASWGPAEWLACPEMRRGLGWAGWAGLAVAGWARPVSDKLWPAGGLLVGLGLSLVSDTSDRPGQQEVMLFRTKKLFE